MASQRSSQKLAAKLDKLPLRFPGCVDVVTVNSDNWFDRMYFRFSGLSLDHSRELQDNGRMRLWSAHRVNGSDVSVILFSRESRPLCRFRLKGVYRKNVTTMVTSIDQQLRELIEFYKRTDQLSSLEQTEEELAQKIDDSSLLPS